MPINLSPGQFVTSTLSLIGETSQQPVPATFTNIVFTVANTSIAKTDAAEHVIGVADGNTDMSVSATATYINSFGKEVTEDLTCHLWDYNTPVD